MNKKVRLVYCVYTKILATKNIFISSTSATVRVMRKTRETRETAMYVVIIVDFN